MNGHPEPSDGPLVVGVVDCEDVPLNISRESLQDSDLVRRLGEIIAKRIIKFLVERARSSSIVHTPHVSINQSRLKVVYTYAFFSLSSCQHFRNTIYDI